MNQRAFVIDTETASLDGGVVDLGIIEIDSELNVIRTWESLIDPGVRIAPSAQAVHHITDRMVWSAPTMDEYLQTFGNPFEGAENPILIGHKVAFDIGVLKGVVPEVHTRCCTLRMARNLWIDIDPKRESHKLEVLAIMFGLESGPAHRAMGDAVTCLNLLRHIADVTRVSSFEELIALGGKPLSLDTFIGFGKYGPNGTDKVEDRGTRLRDLPQSYVSWLRAQKDMDPDLIAALAMRQ